MQNLSTEKKKMAIVLFVFVYTKFQNTIKLYIRNMCVVIPMFSYFWRTSALTSYRIAHSKLCVKKDSDVDHGHPVEIA
jgi:hypothetical protein